MTGGSLRERCGINTNRNAETFVGIRCENGEIRVQFPMGYAFDGEDDRSLQRDIFLLLGAIRRTTARKESRLISGQTKEMQDAFPLHAYLAVLLDFFERGYYRERETVYRTAKRGKIHWGRTIRTVRPLVQGNEVLYLDFVTRQNKSSERELITRIHEYCVYESFAKAGWLFLSGMPERPKIPLQKKKFLTVLQDKLSHTFDDKNRRLFRCMIQILSYQGNADADGDFYYGTNRFEYVWERLIDEVFGTPDKSDFFPRTSWIIGDTVTAGSHLRPDTIMVYGGDSYVLDAKYYRYGVSLLPGDLPETASVHKQITYGEYIASQRRFAERYGEGMRIYNAFLMPYDASDPRFAGGQPLRRIGEAVSDWKGNQKSYERVQGILVDVKDLMRIAAGKDATACERLADCIRRHVDEG